MNTSTAPTLDPPAVPVARWEPAASYPDPAIRTLDPRFDAIKPPLQRGGRAAGHRVPLGRRAGVVR